MRQTHRLWLTALVCAALTVSAPIASASADDPIDGPAPNPTVTEPGQCTMPLGPGADLSGCDFRDADLSGVDLSYANLTDAVLAGTDLTDAVLLGVTATRVDLSGALLRRTTLLSANLVDANLSSVAAKSVNLTGANLDGADLDHAVLSNAQAGGATLVEADLANALLDGADLTSADLTDANADDVDFSATTLTDTTFARADLTGATFTGRVLSGLHFTDADLTGADLQRTKLVRADLAGVNLTNANLLRADLSHAVQTDITWHNTRCPDGYVTTAEPCPGERDNEAGFIRVDAIPYTMVWRPLWINKDFHYTTTPVNLFYEFQPVDADDADPQDAPLFVMLNGGPGAATTANLFANNTAEKTLNIEAIGAGAPGFADNPDSWTSMGNLLYIDPPQTGFSYSLNTRAATYFPDRVAEYFTRGNFNSFIDADQVLRAVLSFLDKHPDLQNNPIVLVGESYGGTRVSTMLNMLLFSSRYGDGGSSFFHDPGLVDAIAAHFADIGVTGQLTPTVVAKQFGRQVLIQPQLTSYQTQVQSELYWPSDKRLHSVIDDVATDAGKPGGFTRDRSKCSVKVLGISYQLDPGACAIMVYVPEFGRDRYNWKQDADWSDRQEAFTAAQLNQLGKLNAILGVDVAQIPEFPADARRDLAYGVMLGEPWKTDKDGVPQLPGFDEEAVLDTLQKQGADLDALKDPDVAYQFLQVLDRQEQVDSAVAKTPSADSLEAHFGKLGDADRYYSPWSQEVYAAFSLNYFALENYVLPISADKKPTYGEMFLENARYVQTFLTDADYDLVINSEALPMALRKHSDTIKDVVWVPAQGEGTGTFVMYYRDGQSVPVYYPRYSDAGHAVGASQPGKLHNDVARWLRCTSDTSCFTG